MYTFVVKDLYYHVRFSLTDGDIYLCSMIRKQGVVQSYYTDYSRDVIDYYIPAHRVPLEVMRDRLEWAHIWYRGTDFSLDFHRALDDDGLTRLIDFVEGVYDYLRYGSQPGAAPVTKDVIEHLAMGQQNG